VVPLGPRVSDEIKWRAYVGLGTLQHCRAVAGLAPEELAEVEALVGASLADAAETGRALLDLSETDLTVLPSCRRWDHQAMRKAARAPPGRHQAGPADGGAGALLARVRRAEPSLMDPAPPPVGRRKPRFGACVPAGSVPPS
jgi:hypothetical protein